jgi:MFS family permease
MTHTLKWREVFSLAGLNAAIVISWIAYHEYQPVLIEKFNFSQLAEFLVLSKAVILVFVPPLAGLLADYILTKKGNYFTVFTVGIGATAMIFMVVATIIGAGPLSAIRGFLPLMIILWLIAMNLFISPANSMIESFAPAQKLPIVMGVLVFTTELLYALEPLIVSFVTTIGDTLTFIIGGILIAVTGLIFQRVSSNEVIARKKELLEKQPVEKKTNYMALIAIIIIGLQLGVGKAVITELLPDYLVANFNFEPDTSSFISFLMLGMSAVIAFILGFFITKLRITNVLITGFAILVAGVIGFFLSTNGQYAVFFSFIVAVAFSLLNISGLPFTLKNLSVRHITYGVGIFIGASEVFSGLIEYYLH